MILRQLFDAESSTYTYVLACEESRDAEILRPLGFRPKPAHDAGTPSNADTEHLHQ